MVVSSVTKSCAHCPAEGVGSTAASADSCEEWTSSSTPQSLSPMGNIVVAVSLACIGIFGFLSNFVVLSLFYRFRALRTPMNLLLVSISASDLMVSVLGTPFSFAASTQGQWLIGHAGCVWYGFINACLGIVSLISLAVLSYERYCTMISPTIADNKNYRSAVLGIGFSWLYSLAWTVPPLLGWSKYGPEGPGTTCSVDWKTQSANNISYIVCLFIFCLALPFGVIIYCYGKLLHTIRQVNRVSSLATRRREQRVLVMVITMVVSSIAPSLLAKFSTIVNPFIYIFMNKQFYRCFRALFGCSTTEQGSTLRAFSCVMKTLRTACLAKDHVSAPALSSALHTPQSIHGSPEGAGHVIPPLSSQDLTTFQHPDASSLKPKLTLIVHYRT
uniref:Teleost multiple tissue opsin b n=1 Tax=Mastacembelus armatus TaxID=205130 RepID=A0A3Q3M3P3_9TELE